MRKRQNQICSLPTLKPLLQNDAPSGAKIIHSRIQHGGMSNCSRYPTFDFRKPANKESGHWPIRMNPRITQTFTQFKKITAMNSNDFLYQKSQLQKYKRLERLHHEQIKQQRLAEKNSINYLHEEGADDETEFYDQLMLRVKSDADDDMPEIKLKF